MTDPAPTPSHPSQDPRQEALPLRGTLLHPAHPPADREVVERLGGSGAVRIERIVSRGHASPPGFWYDQEEEEWVAVLKGRARLRFRDPDEEVEVEAGDFLRIPPHRPHRVEWTTPDEETVWLAVFHP
jgi:cupin 2 domain-containing protein